MSSSGALQEHRDGLAGVKCFGHRSMVHCSSEIAGFFLHCFALETSLRAHEGRVVARGVEKRERERGRWRKNEFLVFSIRCAVFVEDEAKKVRKRTKNSKISVMFSLLLSFLFLVTLFFRCSLRVRVCRVASRLRRIRSSTGSSSSRRDSSSSERRRERSGPHLAPPPPPPPPLLLPLRRGRHGRGLPLGALRGPSLRVPTRKEAREEADDDRLDLGEDAGGERGRRTVRLLLLPPPKGFVAAVAGGSGSSGSAGRRCPLPPVAPLSRPPVVVVPPHGVPAAPRRGRGAVQQPLHRGPHPPAPRRRGGGRGRGCGGERGDEQEGAGPHPGRSVLVEDGRDDGELQEGAAVDREAKVELEASFRGGSGSSCRRCCCCCRRRCSPSSSPSSSEAEAKVGSDAATRSSSRSSSGGSGRGGEESACPSLCPLCCGGEPPNRLGRRGGKPLRGGGRGQEHRRLPRSRVEGDRHQQHGHVGHDRSRGGGKEGGSGGGSGGSGGGRGGGGRRRCSRHRGGSRLRRGADGRTRFPCRGGPGSTSSRSRNGGRSNGRESRRRRGRGAGGGGRGLLAPAPHDEVERVRRRRRRSSRAAAAAPAVPSQHLRELLRIVLEDLAGVDELCLLRESRERGEKRRRRREGKQRSIDSWRSIKKKRFLSPSALLTVCLSAGGFPSYVCDSLALSSATESSARAVSTKSGAQLLAGFFTESERSGDDDDGRAEEEEEGAVEDEAGSTTSSRGGRGGTMPPWSAMEKERKERKKESSSFSLPVS